MIMTFSDYAKSIGKSKVYIHKLYKQGRLKKALVRDQETGKIMVNKKIADKILFGTNMLNNAEFISTNQLVEDTTILNSSTDEARRFKICFEAIGEKNKVYKENETLVLKADVEKEASTAALIYRDRMLGVPGQIAAKLVGLTSQFEIKKIMTEHIMKVLDKISTKTIDNENELMQWGEEKDVECVSQDIF